MTAKHKCEKETEIALIKQQQQTFEEKLDGMRDDLKEIKAKLLGNGKPGLCDELAEIRGERKTIIWVTGIVCTIITIGVTIILKLIKL